MNDQFTPASSSSEADSQPQAAMPHAQRAHGVTHALAHLSIAQMTLGLVLVVFLWQWFDTHRQIDHLQQELASRLSVMDGNNQAGLALAKQQQEATRELSAKVAVLETQNAEMQNQRAALMALYQDLSGSRDDTVLADVEQMLLIANQQLQLSANVKAALIAMQQADERLQHMDRAALIGVRKVIARDMEKLRVVPSVDVPGISAQLDDILGAVDTMPLTQELRLQQETAAAASTPLAGETSWQRFWREVWEEARHLVLIENTQKRELPLLAPNEVFFLRENLKLHLLSARLALLAHDDASFKQELQLAQGWVQRYFDAQSPAGAEAIASLRKLRASSISIQLPDISDSLAAVRNYRISIVKGGR